MSSDITIEAVRLALGMQELRARVASTNIANAGVADARAMRVDFGGVETTLTQAMAPQAGSEGSTASALKQMADELPGLTATASSDPIQTDAQVAEMVAAGASYQALGEALSRHFGLMRLAISGRN